MSMDSIVAANVAEASVSQVTARERIQLVDARNRPCGSAWRAQMRRMSYWHRATYIVVRNSSGQLCAQRRTLQKEVFPGGIDLAAGGVVCAGEAVRHSAERELAEELGIRKVKLGKELAFVYRQDGHHIFGSIYGVIHDGPLELQEEEVAQAFWVEPDEAMALPEVTPDTLLAVRLLRERERW